MKPQINAHLTPSFPHITQKELLFPFRYTHSTSDQSIKTDPQSFFCLNPYLNRYTMPSGSVRNGQDARKVLSSLLGDNLLSLLPPEPSFSDCIRLLSYAIGFFSASDLTYYFGIDYTFMRSFLVATTKSYHNLIRYKSRKNFNAYHYYLFKPAAFPYKSWYRSCVSPVSYAGKTISPRSIPHIYSTSLSVLMMGLWNLRTLECYFEFHPEISLGNYKNAAMKATAKVTIDTLCIIRKREDNNPRALICLEQDMGTENYSILLNKLFDYSHTYYFDDKAADGIYIMFSCNRLIAAKTSEPLSEKKWFVALYALFRQFLSLQRSTGDVLQEDMLSAMSSLIKYYENLCKRGSDAVLSTIHKYGICTETKEDSYFGVPLPEIDQCILSLADKIPNLIDQLLTSIGLFFPAGGDALRTGMHSYYNKQLPLRVFHEFLNAFPRDKDYLARIFYNKSLYDIALSRHRGFAQAILSVMLLKRTINTGAGARTEEHSVIFLYPIYQGYSIYTVATPLLSNYMPYMLWDRDSKEISYIENCISPYLLSDISSFSYSPLSPQVDIGCGGRSFSNIQNGAYFPDGKFRHYYSATLQGIDGGLVTQRFCVEDLDADTGAYCRAYLFLRYYCSIDPMHLIMLVDSPESAIAFYNDSLHGRIIKGFLQSTRCRVPLYANDTYDSHTLLWDTPRLLFLEKGNRPFADKRLFAVTETGSIVYYR